MFVKTNFKGVNMFKYTLGVWVLNLILIMAFVATAAQYGINIIHHIEDVVNAGLDLDLMLIVKQIGWAFLWLIIFGVVEAAIIFGVVKPIANAELKRGW
jgi:hypothetical protein